MKIQYFRSQFGYWYEGIFLYGDEAGLKFNLLAGFLSTLDLLGDAKGDEKFELVTFLWLGELRIEL